MSFRTISVTCLLTFSALAAGCGGVIAGPSSVMGGVWRLQSFETTGGGLLGVSRPESYTVEFGEASRLAVKADCNSCGGTYSISGDSLQIGAMACTRAFCGASSHDTAFLDILTSARSFGVQGIELSIHSSKGVARLSH